MPARPPDALAERQRIVDEHIGRENAHDLDGIVATFGQDPRHDDEPWDAHDSGRDEVRAFYAQTLTALPDLHIEVRRRHVATRRSSSKSSSAVIISARGAGFRQAAVRSAFRSAGSTPSTRRTGWPVRRSTTTARRSCASSASFTSPTACAAGSRPR